MPRRSLSYVKVGDESNEKLAEIVETMKRRQIPA